MTEGTKLQQMQLLLSKYANTRQLDAGRKRYDHAYLPFASKYPAPWGGGILLFCLIWFLSAPVMAGGVVVVLKNTQTIEGDFVSMDDETLCISKRRQEQQIPKAEIDIVCEPKTRKIIYANPAPNKKYSCQETEDLLNRYAIFPDRPSDFTIQPLGVYTVSGIGTVEFQTRLTDRTTIAPRLIWIQPFTALMNSTGPTFTGFGGGIRYRYYPLGHISPRGLFIGAVGEYISASSHVKPGYAFTASNNGDWMDSYNSWAAGLEIGYRFVVGHAFVSSASWTVIVTAELLYHFDKRYTADGVREVTYGAISPGLGFGIAF